MASPAQMAANRRNAQRSTGPRTDEGKKAVRLNAVTHGMTAKVIILGHESSVDYHEIRASLIESYEPASSQELMMVDQVAMGYWRTIRARRFETILFDEQIRAKKRRHRKDLEPNAGHDDSVAVAFLQEVEPKELDNYFRYDGTISRDYYRAINTLEKMQAARRRKEDRDERKREKAARELDRILNHPDPDTIAERSPEPPPVRHRPAAVPTASKAVALIPVNSIGFVSSQPQKDEAAAPSHAFDSNALTREQRA